jgi:hypothetical protein
MFSTLSATNKGQNMTEFQATIADICCAIFIGALLTVGALAYFDCLFF